MAYTEEKNKETEWDRPLVLGNFTVHQGESVSGFLKLEDGEFEFPATVIRGDRPGKTVLITAGIHPGEYVGVEAAVELGRELRPEKIDGTVIIIKVISREEFEQRKGSAGMTGGRNLYRLFPGNMDGERLERLADLVTRQLLSIADYYIDLHSGDDYEELTPYVYYAGKAESEVSQMSRKMAQQVDVPYMVMSLTATGGSYNYAASIGVPSIMIERGGMGGWTMEEVQSTKRDVRNILKFLGVCEGQRDYRHYYPLDVKNVQYQAANVKGLWYPRKKAGDLIIEGEVLGVVKDYEGRVLEVSRAVSSGVILYQTGSLQVVKKGPMIAYGEIAYERDERKERITSYWTKRSDSFMEQRREELHSALADRWMQEITQHIPQGEKLKILDVGCGAGFFSILLAKYGHEVTGIDLTPDMIRHAQELAEEEKVDSTFRVMDAENPEFADETFDLVISRNLTWTLPDPAKAYREWSRVLKKGGVLLNFDANYGAVDFADTSDLPANHTHNQIETEMMQECEDIKRQLPISSHARPAWDLETLGKIGMEQFAIDLGISKRIYVEKDQFYNPTPLFLLKAMK